MSVEDWARREAEEHIEGIEEIVRGEWAKTEDLELKRDLFADGIVHAFSALLSDEAVEAVIISIRGMGPDTLDRAPAEDWEIAEARAALQAAITAVTEGDTE